MTKPKTDEERAAEIDAAVAEREKNYCPTPKYDWEIQKEALDDLEEKREYWHREAMKHSGLAAHYRKALEEISKIYPHTSAAGDFMAKIAHEALGRPYRTLGRE